MTSFGQFTDPKFKAVHDATLAVLGKTGFQAGSEILRARCREKGFKTQGDRIFITPDQVAAALAGVPERFRLLARNPSYCLEFSPGKSHVGLGRSAAFVFSENKGRRRATRADFMDFIKLGQQLGQIRLAGNVVTPSDMDASQVNDFMMAAQIRCSDKPYHLLHESDLPLLCAAFGIDRAELGAACARGEVYAHTTVNTLSPLSISRDQADHLMAMADNGIAIHISPAPAMGSSAPCTIAGTLVMNNAEVLAVLVMTQALMPGLPVLYGVFPSGTDMRTMGATYGSPEARLLEQGGVEMAKAYGLMTRGNVAQNDTFACDFQAGAEAMFNFCEPFRLGINYLPGCGLLGSFAGASKAKLIFDAELSAYMERFYQPWSWTPEDLAVELIDQVGPRGSYISQPHTFARCRGELHHPKVFCRGSYEKWADKASLEQQANAVADKLIAAHVCPALPKAAEKMVTQILAP